MIEKYEAEKAENLAAVAKEANLSVEQAQQKVSDVATKLGLGDLEKRLDLSSDPAWIKAMIDLSGKVSEDTLVLSGAQNKEGDDVRRDDYGRPIIPSPEMRANQ